MCKSKLFQEWVNLTYRYVDASDPDMQKELLDNVVDFAVRLHSSWVDNDKPKHDWVQEGKRVNEEILRIARRENLRVMVGDREVVFRE